jgi:predicted acylesterase/phospholipase RssA
MKDPADKPFFSSSEAFVVQEKDLLQESRGKAPDSPWLGLALSGGGIRSATFCLGALQALAERDLLKKFDYISSVSGGGYIASALQWWWEHTTTLKFGSDRNNFPYGLDFGPTDQLKIPDRILDYLRSHGRYLIPGDGLTVWSAVSVVLRTLFLNLLVWLAVATLIFLVLIAAGQSLHQDKPITWIANPFPAIIYASWVGNKPPQVCGGAVVANAKAVAVTATYDRQTSRITGMAAGRQSNCVLKYPLGLMLFPWLAYLIVWGFIVYSIALSFMSWVDSPEFAAHSRQRRILSPLAVLAVASVLGYVCGSVALDLGKAGSYDTESLVLFAFCGIGAVLVLTSVLFMFTASNYVWRRRFEVGAGEAIIPAALLFAFGSVPLIPYYLMNYGGTFSGIVSVVVSLIGGAGSAVYGHLGQTRGKTSGLVVSLLAAAGSLVFIYSVLIAAYFLAQLAINTDQVISLPDNNSWTILRAAIYTICAIGTLLIYFTNINLVGLHRFYRDRLMETFMPSIEVVYSPQISYSPAADSLKLTDLWKSSATPREIPYPIINTNVILVNDEDPKVRQRGGASFILTPWYVGSDITGWEETQRHTKKNGTITLASAMATSGAAASSNAGFIGTGVTRNRVVSVILGLLNLRLGLWVKTPSNRPPSRFDQRPNHFSPGLTYGLLRYGYHGKAAYSELSDGGHFDNLGIYELVRRKAKLIVAFDVEADEGTNLSSLVSVVQRVKEDFETIIDLEGCADSLLPRVDDAVFPTGAQWTDAPYFAASVTYKGGERAKLIYIKASLIKKLSFLSKAYRAHNADFPHQSTVDQFFEPAQFEAYRELGFKSALEAIDRLNLKSYVEDPAFLAGI